MTSEQLLRTEIQKIREEASEMEERWRKHCEVVIMEGIYFYTG